MRSRTAATIATSTCAAHAACFAHQACLGLRAFARSRVRLGLVFSSCGLRACLSPRSLMRHGPRAKPWCSQASASHDAHQ
jgi:hypothetical protein